MLFPMKSGRSTEATRPRRWGGRVGFAVTLLFLLATLFASGIEITGVHHHDTAGPHHNCVLCRVVSGPVDSGTQNPVPLALNLPEARGDLAPVLRPQCPAPHLVHIRLRAPPLV